jgi:hypothetical protein
MTDQIEHNMREDRLMRDAARALVDADIANLRADIAARSIPTRIMDRIGEGAADVLDEAVAVADDNKGAIATLVAAIALWFARHPIMDLFNDAVGREERQTGDDR